MIAIPPVVGHKVVCLFDDFAAAVYQSFAEVPKAGQVYTVSESLVGQEYGSGRPVHCVRLAELPCRGPGGAGFCYWRVRPLEEEKRPRREGREAHGNEVARRPRAIF